MSEFYFDEESGKQAYDLMMQFGKIAVEINGNESHLRTHPEFEALSRLGDTALMTSTSLLRKIPAESLRRLESKNVNGQISEQQSAPSFGPVESSVLKLLTEGYSSEDIAEELSKTRTTINTHLGNVYKKLGVSTAPSALAKANELDEFKIPSYEFEDEAWPTLTQRQKEIINMRMDGKHMADIADALGVSRHTAQKDIVAAQKGFGVDSTARLVVKILGAGGLDKFTEPKPEASGEDSTKTFIGPEYQRPLIRRGMYATWLSEIFLSFPDVPFAPTDIGKILYGEEYCQKTHRIMYMRAWQLLLGALRGSGKGSIPRVKNSLASQNLVLSKVKLPKSGRESTERFISHDSSITVAADDVAPRQGLSDAELLDFALKLRQQENEYQAANYIPAQIDELWQERRSELGLTYNDVNILYAGYISHLNARSRNKGIPTGTRRQQLIGASETALAKLYKRDDEELEKWLRNKNNEKLKPLSPSARKEFRKIQIMKSAVHLIDMLLKDPQYGKKKMSQEELTDPEELAAEHALRLEERLTIGMAVLKALKTGSVDEVSASLRIPVEDTDRIKTDAKHAYIRMRS